MIVNSIDEQRQGCESYKLWVYHNTEDRYIIYSRRAGNITGNSYASWQYAAKVESKISMLVAKGLGYSERVTRSHAIESHKKLAPDDH